MECHLHLGSKEVVLAPSGTYFAGATLHTGDGNKRKDENRREEGRWGEKGGTDGNLMFARFFPVNFEFVKTQTI